MFCSPRLCEHSVEIIIALEGKEVFCRLNDQEWFGLVMQTGNCSVGLACEARNQVDSMKQSRQLPAEDSVGCQN